MGLLNDLKQRGLVKQTVFEEDLEKELDSKMVSFYIGFDPTADSLTIGHFLPIVMAKRLQMAGHKPYILVGGGTAKIGDPSGRSDMRKMLSEEQLQHNVNAIKSQLEQYLSFEGKNGAVLVNNADWLDKLNYIEFIRDIGVCLSVNRMLTAECFKQRLEKGLSFLEFNYMPMQAYDFYYLYKNHNVCLQVGGDDQWSNMLAGADLIRRKLSKPAYALTLPLLLKSDGTKMGKTAGGALWVDKNRTPSYDLFQYFRNVEDVKVEECFRILTFVSLEEISEIMKGDINKAKERLSYEIVKIVRGEEEANNALNQAKASFSGDTENMQAVEVSKNITGIIDLLCELKIANTKSEARRLIEGKAIKINERAVENVQDVLTDEEQNSEFVVHKGKKVHVKVKLV